MMQRVQAFWSNLRASLWFIPALLVIIAIAAAHGLVQLSATLGEELVARWPRLFGAGADGSRGVLVTVASSMITTAGVVFSITIVALSLASTQYTSRLLRNFMRDRTNQTVLGVFVGIFAYCLIVLRTIRAGDSAFVPSLAVFVAVLLAFVGIGYFIYFIHHIAQSIQASQVLSTVAHETIDVIDHLYPDPIGEGAPPSARSIGEETERGPWRLVMARHTGYIQWADPDKLLELANEWDTILWLQRRVGEFVSAGTPLCAVRGAADPDDDLRRGINSCFMLSNQRSIDQDVSFGLRQISDVALKALSPGINDTTTAVMCVDWATAIFVCLAQRDPVSPFRASKSDELRVIAPGPTFEDIFEDTFAEIRQNAGGNVTVLTAMIHGIREIEPLATLGSRRAALARELTHILEVAQRTIPSLADRAKVHDFGTGVAARFANHTSSL